MPSSLPKAREGNVVRVRDVDSALELADQWRKEGKADWFRGQVFPWPPRSSLSRWRDEKNEGRSVGTHPDLDRYWDWIEQRPELAFLADEPEKGIAVAQHFGVPTDLIDFTLSPRIAALFSRDRRLETEYETDDACIYCLDTEEMRKWYESLGDEQKASAQIYPVIVQMTELHRLMTQEGLFLHSPTAWYEAFEPDQIVFERGSTLTESERLQLYPPTSKLEEDLQAFAQANKVSKWAEYAERLSPGVVVRFNPPPEEQQSACFQNRTPEPAADWPHDDHEWISGKLQPFTEPLTIAWPEQTEEMKNWMFSLANTDQLRQLIQDKPELVDRPLKFEIPPTPGALEAEDAEPLSDCLTRAWNGMGSFPYSLRDRLLCFENLLLRGSIGIGNWNSNRDTRLGKMPLGSIGNPNGWCEVEIASISGASTKSMACFGELVEAFRDDLLDVLSDEGRKLRSEDPLELMRRARDPKLVFDFKLLVRCFAQYLIPMQMLLMNDSLPVIFSPAELTYLGPPG